MNERRQAYKKGYWTALTDVICGITIALVYASIFVIYW